MRMFGVKEEADDVETYISIGHRVLSGNLKKDVKIVRGQTKTGLMANSKSLKDCEEKNFINHDITLLRARIAQALDCQLISNLWSCKMRKWSFIKLMNLTLILKVCSSLMNRIQISYILFARHFKFFVRLNKLNSHLYTKRKKLQRKREKI